MDVSSIYDAGSTTINKSVVEGVRDDFLTFYHKLNFLKIYILVVVC